MMIQPGRLPIAQFLREARLRKNVGQCELGRRTGISSQTVSDIERGKRNLPLRFVPAIAKELEVDEGALQAAVAAFSRETEVSA